MNWYDGDDDTDVADEAFGALCVLLAGIGMVVLVFGLHGAWNG